jgi:hypothetical protein
MIVIVLLNLVFLIFDWGFDFTLFSNFIKNISNDFFLFYSEIIHPNFFFYESIFISIFITELFIQWTVSIIYKKYAKWWFYPLIHWYDVLGCIPLGTFAWLRLFRIVSMTFRLHKRRVINLKNTVIYKELFSFYEILVHDVADRSLIELVESAKREIKDDSGDSSSKKENVIAYGVKPNQEELSKVLSNKIHEIIEANYMHHKDNMKEQIEHVIKDGFSKSKELEKLGQLPLVGGRITNKLEKLVSDVTVQLAESLTSKLASDEVTQLMENIINTSLVAMMKENKEVDKNTDIYRQLNTILKDIVDRILQKLIDDIDDRRKKRITVFGSAEKPPRYKER